MDNDINSLLKDSGVRYLLQRIHDELENSPTDTQHVFAKVLSYEGKVELFNQNKPIDKDEYFLQFLINKNAINNIKFEVRNKKKDYIDDLLLTPDQFNKPYVLVEFDIVGTKFLEDLCDTAADIFVLNPYPQEVQQNIVLMTINVLRSRVNNENITLSWNDFINIEDAQKIQIVKTLKELRKIGRVTATSLRYNLSETTKDGRVEFTASIICKTSAVPLSKHMLHFKSLALDVENERVFYDKLNKWVEFDKRNNRKVLFEVLHAFIKKELGNKALTDAEILHIIKGRGRISDKIQSHQLDEIIKVIHHLKDKFKNKTFIVRDRKDGCYRLIP